MCQHAAGPAIGIPNDSTTSPLEVPPLTHISHHEVSESEDGDYDINLKPKLPYVEGHKFTILKHKPHEPFGVGYTAEFPPSPGNWQSLSQTGYCLSCDPLEGHTNPAEAQELTITSMIRTGYHQGAQLVEVNETMVAKIYDPLYYDGLNELGLRKENVVMKADGDYSREVAAYEQLQKFPAARAVTPAYYGSWTTDVDTFVGQTSQKVRHKRQIRLILIEKLHGECMEWVAPCYLRKAVRSLILEKALHAEALVYRSGVNHYDFSPRNIMIIGSDYEDPNIAVKDIQMDVKLFDFNVAAVHYHPNYVNRRYTETSKEHEWYPRMQSPIVRFYGQMMEFSTTGWCSNEDYEAEKWLWRHFHNDSRYVPVEWDPVTCVTRPRHQARPHLGNGSDSGISVSSGGSAE